MLFSIRTEPKNSFSSKSSSSQALASVLGGGSTERLSPKSASIFDNPTPPANTGGWTNPFKVTDTSNLPDDPDTNDDEPVTASKPTGGLFSRITDSSKDSNPFNGGKSLFSSGGDQTWSPEKGLNFSAPGGLFASNGNGAVKSSLFNSTNGASSSGFFGSKPASAASTAPSSTASVSASEEVEDGADGQPAQEKEVDRSLQGPGEEDEDVMFQSVLTTIYDMSEAKPKAVGKGALRVLKNRNTGKSRFIARSEFGKVLMNVAISKDVKYILQQKVLLRVPEFLPSGGMKTWGARPKKPGDGEELLRVVEAVKNGEL